MKLRGPTFNDLLQVVTQSPKNKTQKINPLIPSDEFLLFQTNAIQYWII